MNKELNIVRDRAYQRAIQSIILAEEPREEMICDYSEFKKPAHVPINIWIEECTKKVIKEWMILREKRCGK